jgi:hypothetical protein
VAAHAVNGGWPNHTADAAAGAEWSIWYTEYLTRSTTQSAQTLELFQEVLQRVSRGQLSPTAMQELLPKFSQTRSAEYAVRFAGLSSRFFTGLLQIGTVYSREQVEILTPGSSAEEIPPPKFDTTDPVRWFQQLSQYASDLNSRAARAYQSHLDRTAAGERDSGHLQQAAADYLAHRLPEHLREIGRLYFELLSGLGDLRAGYEKDYLDAVLASADPSNKDGVFELRLSAAMGETASATLSLSNTRGERAIIRCTAGDVRRLDGVGRAFVPKITLTPDALELGPGEEGSLRLSLRLDEAEFDADALYGGTVYITGHEESRIEVPIRITATTGFKGV